MIDFEIPEAVELVRQTVARFVDERLLPLEPEVEFDDEQIAPATRHELRNSLDALGLLDLVLPEQEGGAGFGARDMLVIQEERGRSTIGFDLWGPRRLPAVLRRLPPDRVAVYERLAARDELRGALCLTEPGGGSDPASLKTTFERRGDDYVINGAKTFISGAHHANYATVYARERGSTGREGISAFLVETDTPGFQVVRVIPVHGRPHIVVADPCEVALDNVVVPAANRLTGDGGEGWGRAQADLGGVRFALAIRSVALARRCLQMAIDYARQRETFGERLADRQAIQFMLADSYMEIQSTRWMTYRGAWKIDRREDARQDISACKVLATEMLWRVSDRAIQIHGGIGLSKDLPLERIHRNARVDRIIEGPNEVHRWVIARNLLNDRVTI